MLPCVPAAGVPLLVAVPLWLSVKFTPPGSIPVSLIIIEAPVGKPVVFTVNDCPALPGANVVLLGLVIMGAWLTVIETVAGDESRVAAQVALGTPQLSGFPRSVTLNWKLSRPL